MDQMTPTEWESLCDRCAKCCLYRLEDEDTRAIHFTNVHCRLLDAEAFAHRKADMPSVATATEIQGVLFNEHIKVWVPSFCARLQSTTRSPFYSAIGVLTSDFVTSETERPTQS